MEILNNVQQAIFEVKHLIKEIGDVRKLLIHDTANALDLSKPTYEEVAEYVVVAPVFDVTEPPFDKNTIITVSLSKGNYNNDLVLFHGVLNVTILTRSNLWRLNNNKIRPMEIANLIIKTINNQKITTSHKVLFSHLDLSILNDNVSGYTLTFFMEEGSGLDEKF